MACLAGANMREMAGRTRDSVSKSAGRMEKGILSNLSSETNITEISGNRVIGNVGFLLKVSKSRGDDAKVDVIFGDAYVFSAPLSTINPPNEDDIER